MRRVLHDEPVPFEADRDSARDAFNRRAWSQAHAHFTAADLQGALGAADLESWGLAAVLTGHDADSETIRERAHYAYLAEGDVNGAARVAFWLGLALLTLRGEVARSGGWFARMTSVVADAGITDSVWRGYELLRAGMEAVFAGDPATAMTLLGQAIAVAQRFDDADLRLLARNGHGQARVAAGDTSGGLAELDEVMVLATTTDAAPQAVGLVSCAVINACHECMDLRRSLEWTQVLTQWCAEQPGLVPFRGQCTVHRSELLQLRGRWDGAMEEIAQVLAQLTDHPTDHSAGMAHYQHGELCRVRGDFPAAEQAYREALRHGHDPQPGFALLRRAQGRADSAVLAVRRALDEANRQPARTGLLWAGVETGLAAGQVEFARACAGELAEFAAGVDSVLLRSVEAVARGSIALADGRPQQALTALREALAGWMEIPAPYEAARARVLLAQACRTLGDDETAELELAAARSTVAGLCADDEADRLMAAVIPPSVSGPTPAGLTAREVEVLRLVATGASNRDIARTLFLSEKTVARHVANIFTKIEVTSRSAATAYAYAQRLV